MKSRIIGCLSVFLALASLVILTGTPVYPGISLEAMGGFYRFGTGGAYGGRDVETPIDGLVREAGRNFRRAASKFQRFLAIIEMSEIKGIDYKELKIILDDVIIDIMKAENQYEALLDVAEATPYKPEKISRLRKFGYKAFEQRKRLNPALFRKVGGYFKKGDVTGVFRHYSSRVSSILGHLKLVQVNVARSRMPRLKRLWKLNERFAEISLFGSYVSRVLQALQRETEIEQ